jgi:hypothetical protein
LRTFRERHFRVEFYKVARARGFEGFWLRDRLQGCAYSNAKKTGKSSRKIGAAVRKKRKTEIHFEIEEAVAIRHRTVLIAYCQQCRKQSRMIAANEAAVVARLSAREIYRLVEAGHLHYTEDQGGLLYVCADSLQQLVDLRS